ncbi:MAG: N-acetylmuramoyl-L-alanine amidase [Lachnospiraceae bacterium]|nr:N-acetylmuramoyl-L-alanine amidase [Lachnospiraceae bacterium]
MSVIINPGRTIVLPGLISCEMRSQVLNFIGALMIKNRKGLKIFLVIAIALSVCLGIWNFYGNSFAKVSHSVNVIKDEVGAYLYSPNNKEDDREILVCIDAGHGGKDPGAMVANRNEKDETLEVAKRVKKYLEKNDVKVMMTREDDTFLTPKKRAKIANKADADLFISIHRNSLPTSPKTKGIDIYINCLTTDEDYRLGNTLKEYLEDAGKMKVNPPSRGSATDSEENYTVVGQTKMPAALIELGYMTNKKDNKYFDEAINSYAISIADAIVKYIETRPGE